MCIFADNIPHRLSKICLHEIDISGGLTSVILWSVVVLGLKLNIPVILLIILNKG